MSQAWRRYANRNKQRSNCEGQLVDLAKLDLTDQVQVSEQLNLIKEAVSMTEEDITKLNSLYTDLETALQSLWPGCTAIPFGSTTTGLAFKTSDTDCFISIPPQYQLQNVRFVHDVKHLLQKQSHIFSLIRSIPRPKMPIVKFFHTPTKINCDVTFKSPLGTKNSQLLAFLLHTDPRIIPMAVAIKYWAEIQRISGTSMLKNYALTLMIIFFLQQPSISILPSIESLQRDPEDECLVDFWNTGFTEQLPPSSNLLSSSELLGKFFEYYSTFDFDEMVVCPYLGVPIKKDCFNELSLVPIEFELYKTNVENQYVRRMNHTKPFCIQDPFALNHNVALPINVNLASKIKSCFKFAAGEYELGKANNSRNFLITILRRKPNKKKENQKHKNHVDDKDYTS